MYAKKKRHLQSNILELKLPYERRAVKIIQKYDYLLRAIFGYDLYAIPPSFVDPSWERTAL